MAEVDEDVVGAGARGFADDTAGHDVAGGEFLEFVVAVHEAVAVLVEEVGAFASERFREEEAGGSAEVEGGGVELDEFDVADGGSGAVSGGDTIAGGDVRVGSFEVDAAESAGGEQDAAGLEIEVLARLLLKYLDPMSGAVEVEQEIDHAGEAGELDAVDGRGFAIEGAGDLATGGVAMGVEDAVAGVGSFAGEEEAGAILVEVGAPFD